MAIEASYKPYSAMQAGPLQQSGQTSSLPLKQQSSMSPPQMAADASHVAPQDAIQARRSITPSQKAPIDRRHATPQAARASVGAQGSPSASTDERGHSQDKDRSASQPNATPSQAKPMPPRQRLPPTIDNALVHQSLCARQAFFDALLSDQHDALQPEHKTPFKSANDVVKRLLPYHVWHVNEGDIYHILCKGMNGETSASSLDAEAPAVAMDKESSDTAIQPLSPRKAAKRRKISLLDRIPDSFPSEAEANHFLSRYSQVHARMKKLRSTLIGAVQRDINAPFGKESTIFLDRFALDNERELYAEDQERFRREKEQAAAAGVSWDELIRITAMARSSGGGAGNDDSSDEESDSDSDSDSDSSGSEDASSQAARSPQARRAYQARSPATPNAARGGIKRGRGRPRKTAERSTASGQASPASAAPQAAPGYASGQVAAPQMLTSPTMIPQHPIVLVLPLAALPRLSELGITPVPAPHLLPAIRARQAAQAQGIGAAADGAFARYNTAPRPGPPDQQEPALLLGITIGRIAVPGRSGATGGSGAATGEEMLHISVILPKFDAYQLSSLAALMTSLQHAQPGSLPVPSDPRGNTAVGAVVAAYVAGGVNVPTANAHRPQAGAVRAQSVTATSTPQSAPSATGPSNPQPPMPSAEALASTSPAQPSDVQSLNAEAVQGTSQGGLPGSHSSGQLPE